MRNKAEYVIGRESDDFAEGVIAGLSKPRKALPCRFFYDERGSALFEEITRLPEYYLTRAEISILESCAKEMVDGQPDGAVLVEFGSGSSRKTETLIENFSGLYGYVPIDVSWCALAEAKARLAEKFPNLEIRPLLCDFMQPMTFPADIADRAKCGFFPGSTIGNLAPLEATQLLSSMRRSLSPGGHLLIGVDLKKDVQRLIRAYNDSSGVTAAFNMNILHRINRELNADFAVENFRHEAIYNPFDGRIEMRLVSLSDQSVAVRGRYFHFREGEFIHTENSHKYTIEEFSSLARSAGWVDRRVWTDSSNLFSVHELVSL
jgi:dimethylhistidine N-methyltransferase